MMMFDWLSDGTDCKSGGVGNPAPCNPAGLTGAGRHFFMMRTTGLPSLSGADVCMVSKAQNTNLGLFSYAKPCSSDCRF
jgi:hypothetical protein